MHVARGDVLAAVHQNVFVLAALCVAGPCLVLQFLGLRVPLRVREWRLWRHRISLAVVLMLTWTVVRNLPQLAWLDAGLRT